jgi:hypothetical protein
MFGDNRMSNSEPTVDGKSKETATVFGIYNDNYVAMYQVRDGYRSGYLKDFS